MIEPIVPRAQSLRFVSLVDYWTKPFNHDSRLLQHQGKDFDDILVYCTKFHTTDSIRIQFQSDYTNSANEPILLELYDYDDTKVLDITPTKTNLSTTWFQYDATISTSLLLGVYYVKLTFTGLGKATIPYQSDYFEVGNFIDLPLIEWRESDNDGLIYDNPLLWFGFRIEADITRAKTDTENETFEIYNSITVNASSKVKRIVNFECDPLPLTVCEKLDLGFSHEKVRINNVLYVAASSGNMEEIEGTIFYQYDRDITQSEFEVYEQVTSDIAPPDTDYYYSPDGVKFYSPDGIKLYKPFN
jgi:hypothetical protein